VLTRRRVYLLVIMALLAAFAVWLEPTRVVWGWLRGEAFYEGRPTSYWRYELSRYERVLVFVPPPQPNMNALPSQIWLRQRGVWDKLRDWWTNETALQPLPPPAILQGDPAARAVLEALAADAPDHVRSLAAESLLAMDGVLP
jgi:hypothetical protein